MRWLLRWWGRDRLERELDAELAYHLERRTHDLVAAGHSPNEARRRARLELGGVEWTKEACRDVRGTRWIHDAAQDVRFAVRLIRKEPWFSLAAILALAFGMATTTMVATVMNAYYFRGLSGAGDRLQYLGTRDAKNDERDVSYPEFLEWRAELRAFDGVEAYRPTRVAIGERNASPEQTPGAYVSAGVFRLLDEAPVLGRGFTESDDRPGAPPVAILGHRIWKFRYESDPAVVGRTILVDGSPFTVIGVMREGFGFPFQHAVWLPLALLPGLDREARDERTLGVLARLAPGVSAAAAALELDRVTARINAEHPDTSAGVLPRAVVFGRQQLGRLRDDVVPQAIIGAAAFVLLIACANVGSLLLARASARAHELGTRAAIGATRWRIVRQLLVEHLILATAAAAIGLWLSTFGTAFVRGAFGGNVPYWLVPSIDIRVLAIVGGVTVTAALIFGLAPAVHVFRSDLKAAMPVASTGAFTPRTRRWTKLLVGAELAMTVVVLSGAGLMVRSFLVIYRADRWLDPAPLMTMAVALPHDRYASADRRASFFRQLDEQLRAEPSLVAALASVGPFRGAPSTSVWLDGASADQDALQVPAVAIGDRYFQTIGAPLILGSDLSAAAREIEAAVIVNQRFVDVHLQGRNPIGADIYVRRPGETSGRTRMTVIGVARTLRQSTQTAAGPVIYVPFQPTSAQAALIVRHAGALEPATAALRRIMASIDAEVPLADMKPLEETLANSRLSLSLFGTLLAAFASIAVVLSGVGLYAVTAYAVVQRQHEIGVRMALGAGAPQIAWMFVRGGLTLAAGGLALGLAGALLVGQVVRGMLVQTSPTDPITYGGIVLVVIAISAVASLVPARAAVRIDPLRSLRRS